MSLSLLSFLPSVDRGLKNMRTVCDYSTCRNTQLMRSIPGGRLGVQVGPLWYCSIDCFALASHIKLASLCNRRPEIARSPRLSLGLALHSKGYLALEQLRMVTAQSHLDEDEIAAKLIQLGLVTERQVAAARSAQWGYPVFAPERIGQMVETNLPAALLKECNAAPLHYSATAKRIVLGFVSKVEHSVLEAVEQVTGCRVEPCFITPADFDLQIPRLALSPDYAETVVDEPAQPEKMARTVGRVAVDVGAREAAFVQCRGMIWVRVAGKRGKADVIFRINKSGAGFGRKPEFFEDSTAAFN
jgi:Type II secretion system (T2SS), protein E, N-terminal domain